jgi:hypothetical protein
MMSMTLAQGGDHQQMLFQQEGSVCCLKAWGYYHDGQF